MKKYKVGINENLISIFTYIQSSPKYITQQDLLQYCIDYDLYIEYYMNFNIIQALVNERNQFIIASKKKEVKDTK